jgi:hypothetical protein
MNIKEALASLDALDDEQWTQDGAPKTDVVSELVGHKVSRAEIIEAAPKFSRENMVVEDEKEPEVETETETEETVLDNSVLEAFTEMEPMLPEELAAKVLSKIDPMQLESVEKLLIEQIAVSAEKQKEIDEMNRRLKLSLATTRLWIKQLVPDMNNQQAIQQYIKRSQANRAAKNAAVQQILGGAKLSDLVKLDPRAAIDRAFARKTARGGNRPTR